ncbi:MAG: calcium/sodium antiporter [Caldilineaceae bacterium]|nr:calcium/sodium antiporter [Caldilineaceae bacterium]
MNPLLLNTLLFLAGFALLTGGAEFLVRGSSRLAIRMKVPMVVIGLTIVAFGTSLPELMVSLIANLQGGSAADIAIGNVVGSNIANFALILGVVAVLRPVSVERQLLFREYPLMLIVSLVFFAMAWDGSIGRIEGIIFFLGLLGFTYYSYATSRTLPSEEQDELVGFVANTVEDRKQASPAVFARDITFIVIGIIGLLIGANWLVTSSTFLARFFGISELVIGLTLVAVGTSLPELATSAVAILRKEGDIALGNLVGSNLFNMLAIVGITSIVRDLPVPLSMRSVDFPLMIVISVLPLLLVLRKPHIMNRWNGAIMLAIYVAYNVWLFTSGNIQPT